MRRGDGVVTCDKNFRSGRADGLQRFCDTAKLRMVYVPRRGGKIEQKSKYIHYGCHKRTVAVRHVTTGL